MRLLPVRPAHECGCAAAGKTSAHRRGHRSGDDWQCLPLRNLSAHPKSDPSCRKHGRERRHPVKARLGETLRSTKGIKRREFLKFSVAASGGLLIGIYMPAASTVACAQQASPSSFMPNAFVRIGTDERVTVIVNHSEMGQGVYTSLPMLLAEELDADWNKIGFESAPVDPKYNHPA